MSITTHQIRFGRSKWGVITIFACLIGVLLWWFGPVINTTRSIPLGLYHRVSGRPQVGDYVLVCPADVEPFIESRKRGYIGYGLCPAAYGFLMKRVLAAKGDTVLFTEQGVYVNGKLLPLSRPLKHDPAGRAMPRPAYPGRTLMDSDILAMSDINDLSFDSRYFGVLSGQSIRSVIRPVFVW